MKFSDNDLNAFLDAFDAKTIIVRLSGAQVDSVRAIHKRRTEFVSPHSAEAAVILPSLQIKESDLEGITREHTFEIDGVNYRMYKEPTVRDSGFALIGLTKA